MSVSEVTALQAIMVEEDDLELFPQQVLDRHEEGDGFGAYAALRAHLRTVEDPVRRAKIQQYLKMLRLWSVPAGEAPGLFTFNGIGSRLYGSAQRDPEDGTSISTVWATLLYLPVVPIASYVVAPAGGDRWYFIAKTPHPPWTRIPVLGWIGLVAVAIVAILATTFDGATNASVVFYNGFSAPIEVRTAASSWTVPAGAHVEARLPARPTPVAAGWVGEAPFEEMTLELGAGAWRHTIYNVGARDVLILSDFAYGPGEAYDSEMLLGRINVIDPVDYLFVDPPPSRSVSEGRTEHVSQLSAIEEQNPAGILRYCFEHGGVDVGLAYAASAARDGVTDHAVLLAAMTSETSQDRAPAEVCATWLARGQDDVELHRFCQDAQRGRREALHGEYAAKAEAHPDSAMYAYLAGRLVDGDDASAWYAEALERDPDYARAHYAIAFGRLTAEPARAEESLRRAFELDPGLMVDGTSLLLWALVQQGLPDQAIADQLPDADPSLFTLQDMLRLRADPSTLDDEIRRLQEGLAEHGATPEQSANLMANVALIVGDLERLRAANAGGAGLDLWLALSEGATPEDQSWTPDPEDQPSGIGEVLTFLHDELQGRAGALPGLTESVPELARFLVGEAAPTVDAVQSALGDVSPALHGVIYYVYFRRTGDAEFARRARQWALPSDLPYFEVP